jgi:phage gp29-like protein
MATLYDHRGRPIRSRDLLKELAAPSFAGVRQVWYESVANGLTPERLAEVMVAVDQNDILAYLTLAEEMEERDLHYHSVLGTRKLAVAGLPVNVEAHSDDARDVEIADAARELVETDEFREMLPDALDALGKSFSVVEIMWDRSSGARWFPRGYKWRDPRFFQFDNAGRDQLRLRDESDMVNGLELAPFKFIQHRPKLKSGLTIRGGLARLAAVAYMCKGYTIKDWLAFMEVFGMPLRLGKYDKSATADQKATLLAAVTNLGSDAAAIVPRDMELELIEAAKSAGGEKLFKEAADWLDKQVSKGVLGQTMTVEDGSSLSQARVHAEVRQDILEADAAQLSATLRRDLVRPFVDLNFGVLKPGTYPKFVIAQEKPEDLKLLSEALPPFVKLGLPVEASWVRDKFGAPEPDDDALLLGGVSLVPPEETPPEETPPEETPPEETATQRRMRALEDQVAMLLAETRRSSADELDALAGEALGDWQPFMDPVLQPLLELAQRSTSWSEFREGFRAAVAEIDLQRFTERLAQAGFVARGLGDATDDV